MAVYTEETKLARVWMYGHDGSFFVEYHDIVNKDGQYLSHTVRVGNITENTKEKIADFLPTLDTKILEENEKLVLEKANLIAEKDNLVSEKAILISEKEALISAKTKVEQDKTVLITEKEALMAEKESLMAKKV